MQLPPRKISTKVKAAVVTPLVGAAALFGASFLVPAANRAEMQTAGATAIASAVASMVSGYLTEEKEFPVRDMSSRR